MRAEQKMIVAIGAIGLGALGLLLVAKPRTQEEPEPSPGPQPSQYPLPIPIPPSPTPPEPKPEPFIRPTALQYLSSPATVEGGKRYRAIVQISPIEAAIPFVDKRAAIADQFRALGFTDVRVYESMAELPFNWPVETLVGIIDDNRIFFAEGAYSGPTVSLDLPPQIIKTWTDPTAPA